MFPWSERRSVMLFTFVDGNLVEAQLNERLALVQLYQVLGDGWQQ
jgi:hypothetical protein